MLDLPTKATHIDPSLAHIGMDCAFQKLIFGRVSPDNIGAILVARLVESHQDGIIGHFYGVRLLGFQFGKVFRPYGTEPLGEVQWDAKREEWVQVNPPSV